MYEFEPKFYPCSNIHDRRIMLHLEVKEEPDTTESLFWCSGDDFSVPDAIIEIDVDRLIRALAIITGQSDVLESVSIPIRIDSEGYGGEIRQDKLEIRCCPYTGNFWTDAWFVNDWSDSWYSLDTDYYWPVLKDELQGYLKELLKSSRNF